MACILPNTRQTRRTSVTPAADFVVLRAGYILTAVTIPSAKP